MAAIFQSVVCAAIVVTYIIHGDAQSPPFMSPSANIGKNCKFEFIVPDKHGACSSGNAQLASEVNSLKQDLDRTRLQYVTQNSAVQAELSKLQNTRGSLDSQITDLTHQFSSLKTHVASLSLGHGANANLHKAVMDTKDYFIKVMHDIENKIFSLSQGVQKDAIEQSKVNAALEAQMTQQFEKVSETEKKIHKLDSLIQTLKFHPTGGITSGIGPTSGATNSPNFAVLNKLETKVNDLEKLLNTVDRKQGEQLRKLHMKTNHAEAQLSNHSRQLSDLTLQTNGTYSMMYDIDKKATTNHDIIVQFRKNNEARIKQTEDVAKVLVDRMNDLRRQLHRVGTDSMDIKMKSIKEQHDIDSLQMLANLLSGRLKDFDIKLSKQDQIAKELKELKKQVSSLLPATKPSGSASPGTGVPAPTKPGGGKTSPNFPVPPKLFPHGK